MLVLEKIIHSFDFYHVLTDVKEMKQKMKQKTPSVWQWLCDYLFLRLRSTAAEIRTPNLPHAKGTL